MDSSVYGELYTHSMRQVVMQMRIDNTPFTKHINIPPVIQIDRGPHKGSCGGMGGLTLEIIHGLGIQHWVGTTQGG